MIDFNRQPSPKTAEEKRFDELRAEYLEKFGTPYVFDYGADSMTWAEALADIKRRIDTGTPQTTPEYKRGAKY